MATGTNKRLQTVENTLWLCYLKAYLFLGEYRTEFNSGAINHDFSLVRKMYRDTTTDIGLDLPDPPVWLTGMAYKHAGFKQRVYIIHGERLPVSESKVKG